MLRRRNYTHGATLAPVKVPASLHLPELLGEYAADRQDLLALNRLALHAFLRRQST
jgi:hypothetical protein